MSVLRRLVASETRAVQSTTWGQWPGDGGASWSGVSVDNTSALQLLTVYGCNRFICDGISTLPVDVYRQTADGPVPVAKPVWLSQPTVDLDFTAWATQVLTSLLLDGNAYCLIIRNERGDIQELVPLNPSTVTVRRERGVRVYEVGGVPVPSYELLHIPGVMFPGSETGLSPIEAARQTVGAGIAANEFAARFFGQGLSMPGVIEHPNELTDDQARVMANSFARRHAGKGKSHLPGVLTAGAKWASAGVTNEQAQFLQTRQFTAAEICSFLFLIDPTEFGVSMDKGSSVTYANLEQRNARKVQVTFLPWLVRLDNALTSLVRQSNRYVKINPAGLLRGDTKTRYETHAIGIASKFLLPNEARELEDRAPIPGGDKFAEPPAPVAPASTDEEPTDGSV